MEQGEATERGHSRWQRIARDLGALRVLAIGTGLYLLAGSVFLASVGANPIDLIGGIGRSFVTFFYMASLILPWWAIPLVLLPFVVSRKLRQHVWRQRSPILVSIMLCSLFTFMFGLVKNRMVLAAPFWADDLFTQLDLMLHFGHSPRDLLDWLAPLHTGKLLGFYFNGWVFLATFFPVMLVAFDPDVRRRNLFTVLWMLCWCGLGNAAAMSGMSYGPIFADLFPGGPAEAHPGALALLQREDARSLLATKMFLWNSFTGETEMLGSGISAFPSVHVGMATVLGLYLVRLGGDLSRCPGVSARFCLTLRVGTLAIAVLYVCCYEVLSVYLGWHYAVDGYASILMVGGGYLALARCGAFARLLSHSSVTARARDLA